MLSPSPKSPVAKVIFATPFMHRPYPQYLDALEASLPLIEAAGWEHGAVQEVGNCYISNAMDICLRRALNGQPDVIVFIDYDMSWEPKALLKLIQTEGDVVGGTYRFKKQEPEYMGGLWPAESGHPIQRNDGCLKMTVLPSGFLKITRTAVNKFMKAYPQLVYGEPCYPYIDLFNHGAIDGVWFGQDYAFCKRWNDMGENVWCVPDLNITHHHKGEDGVTHDFPGNYHDYLCALPGGSNDPARLQALKTLNANRDKIEALIARAKAKPKRPARSRRKSIPTKRKETR